MNEKHGEDIVNESSATQPEDWNNAVVTRSMGELRGFVRKTRGKNKLPTKEQVSIRYSPEVLAYFRATGKGWQTRMDEVLREYVTRKSA